MKRQAWWETAVIYQIFPNAFANGKFSGIESQLTYIKSLGIDAIWLCPIFMSPFKDAGYDISDYFKVNRDFGSMAEFKALLARAHELKLKVMLDIALNHTSHEHNWFKEALDQKDSPYRDYYIFRQGKSPGAPPNNWISSKTRKSAWTYNPLTKDYYLHIYTKYQPDLNWANPTVRKMIRDILFYWLDLGVDGFRLDVINKIAKPDLLKTESERLYADYLYENHPRSHDYIKELNQSIKAKYPECFLLGQISGVTPKQAALYAGRDRQELDSFLQFEHMDIDALEGTKLREWPLEALKVIIDKWQQLGADVIGTTFLANHDSARAVSHFTKARGEEANDAAMMLVLFQLCLKGIPIIYMGDELAMTNVEHKSIEAFEDIRSKDIYDNLRSKGKAPEAIIQILNQISRDNARALVDTDLGQKSRVTAFYRWLIHYRRTSELLMHGAFKLLESDDDLFVYTRTYKEKVMTVVCNFSASVKEFEGAELGALVKSTCDSIVRNQLSPFEGRMYLD